MPRARYSLQTSCEQCGKTYLAAKSNSRFCSDKCRVSWHRQQKTTPKKVLEQKAEKYDRLIRAMADSIKRHERLAVKAMEKSKEDRPTIERVNFIAMGREKEELVKELKFLLELSETSYEERIAALYDVDPVNYD